MKGEIFLLIMEDEFMPYLFMKYNKITRQKNNT